MKPDSPRRSAYVSTRIALTALLIVALSCEMHGAFDTPLLRVDLRRQIPSQTRRIAASGVVSLCRKRVEVAAAGLAPTFVVSWRSLRVGDARYVSAVEVTPAGDGRIQGLGGPKGSATVGKMTNVGTPSAPVGAVPVLIHWSGKRGCGSAAGSAKVTLRADDASCKAPASPKLLRPVK